MYGAATHRSLGVAAPYAFPPLLCDSDPNEPEAEDSSPL